MCRNWLMISVALVVVRAGSPAAEGASAAAEAPAFFAFCMDTHDSARRSPEQQAQLLRELGYDGAGHLWLDELAERVTTLDAAGLRLFQVYLQVNIAPDMASPYDARLEEALPLLRGRDCMLALLVNGMPPSDPAGDARAVAVVREIADAARAVGARVVLYPHADFWLERIEDGLRVAEQVERPNVGVMFNLCHWLKVDGKSELRALLAPALPRLWAVSIHGADTAAEVQAGTGAMIRPLDEGAFDVRGFVRLLAELGYAGPIGLVAHHVQHEGQRTQAVAEPQHIGPALCIINGTRLLRCFHQLLHLPGHCRDGGASLFTVEHHQNTGNCFKFGDGRAGLLRFLRMAEKIVQRPFHFAHGAA